MFLFQVFLAKLNHLGLKAEDLFETIRYWLDRVKEYFECRLHVYGSMKALGASILPKKLGYNDRSCGVAGVGLLTHEDELFLVFGLLQGDQPRYLIFHGCPLTELQKQQLITSHGSGVLVMFHLIRVPFTQSTAMLLHFALHLTHGSRFENALKEVVKDSKSLGTAIEKILQDYILDAYVVHEGTFLKEFVKIQNCNGEDDELRWYSSRYLMKRKRKRKRN